MITRNTLRCLLGAGLLSAGLAARADDTVTFQVDLSRYTNSAGNQVATLVDVRGAFNSWNAGSPLINNGANVYTNSYTVVGNTGDKFQYKFTYTTSAGVTWEDNNPPPGAGQPPDEGNNRVLQLGTGSQTLPVVPFYAPSVSVPINLFDNKITYRVDMTEQIALGNFIPGIHSLRVTGNPAALTAWGAGVDCTNNAALSGDASNIYSAVVIIPGAPGSQGGAHKFRANNGWEDTATGFDRNFTIIGGDQVLPVVYYEDRPVGPTTNGTVTFSVDMTPQVLTGGFTNGVSAVTISGRITGWGGGAAMTNDPALSGNASNVYSTTVEYASDTVGNWSRFKFRADGGWETAPITFPQNNNNDRRFFTAGGDQVLPLYTYNDASICDLLLQPTTVTIKLHLTNGTPDNNGVAFDSVNDQVYINGEFLQWPGWNTSLPQMTNNPVGSDSYEQTFVLPSGYSRRVQFKFGIAGAGHNGLDNEAPVYSDHVNYVRTLAATATLGPVEFGTNFSATRVEQPWGNLTIGHDAAGQIPISWLGLPCVTLQTKTTVVGEAPHWADLPATDGKSSTNWPNAGGVRYFRLQKRPLP